MEQILFIDACMRGPELSRTNQLCQHFLQSYQNAHPQSQVIHRHLPSENYPLLNGERSCQREQWVKSQPDHPLLLPAREVAQADLILVGAPYWDLSFPAALKVYLEWASTQDITFRYTEEGQQVGMARAKALVYCTTGGGPISGQNYGYEYTRGLAAMWGIQNTFCVAAEGLDMWGSDIPNLLQQAKDQLTALVSRLCQNP